MSDWNVVKTEKLDDWAVVSQEPETAGFLESMGISLGESLKGARRAVDAVRVLGNELPSAQRQFYPNTVPTNDQIFTEQKSLEDYIDSVVNPDKKRAHWTGQLAAGVPTMLLNLASSPFTTGQTFLDQGESLGRAGMAAGIDTAMNAAGVALPVFGPMRNAGKLVGAATGAGANIAQDVASRSMIQAVAEKESTKKIFENTPETIALAGITGGVFGGAAVPSRKATAKAKTDIDNLRTKIAEKEAAEKAATESNTILDPDLQAQKPSDAMSPSQLKAWKEYQDAWHKRKAEQEAAAKAQAVIDARQQQLEFEMKQRVSLEQNAAERARQEAAPTGFEEWKEGLRQSAETRLPGDNTPLPWKPTGEVVGRKHEQDGIGNEGRKVRDVLNNQEADLPFKDPNALDFQEFYAGKLAEDLDRLITKNNNADLADKVNGILNENPALYKQVLDILQGNGKLDKLSREVLQILQTGKPTPPKPTFRGMGRKQGGAIDFQSFLELFPKFGKSKVQTPVYHGTTKEIKGDFRVPVGHQGFYGSKGGLGPDGFIHAPSRAYSGNMGTWFSSTPKGSDTFAGTRTNVSGGNMHQVYINLENPKVFETHGDFADWFQAMTKNGESASKARRDLIKQGYDGVLIKESDTDGGGMRTDYVVFNKEQIKSAISPPGYISKGMGKQSGRVDFQGIIDSLSKAAERIANAFKSQKTPSDHILKLTGVDMIKKGPTADEMLARQAAAGPVPEANFWTNWNSGLSMLADKFPKVPLIKDMNQWLRYVHRKISKSDREVRQPLEKLAVQLGKDSQVKMALIAKSESLRKQYYTDAEYAEFGLNPREIKFMRSVQEAHRISNELQSTSAIEALGKGVREQAGYYTHDFSGPVKITATIIGKDGKPTTYRTREDSMVKAKKAEAWLKANRGATDITIEQLHTNYDHNRSHDRTRSSLEALIEIHQGNEDKVSIVKDILSDLERARAEGVGGHDQHLYDKKTFAEGYSGDRPWRSDVENATDWWQKQINMTSETARWAAINEMMAEYKKVMADPEVQKMGKFKDVINEYVLQEMGMRSSTWKAFEEKSMQALMNYMPEKLGKGDVAALKDLFASMKSLAYIKALSASAGYTLVTPIQVIGMGIPEYGRLLANGEVRLKDGTPFIMDVMDGVMMGTFEAKNTVFSANQKMWEFFMENDVVPRRVVDDYKNINSNQGVDLTMSTLNFMIAKPDQMARAAAAFAFGKALERGGKYATPEEAWARAAEITSKVAMPITKQDRPLIVDSAGQVGNLAFFLHTPLFATWNAANIFVRNIAQADTPSQKAKSTAAFAFFLAAMAASGGLGEMMGVNELSQLNDIALGGLSYTNPELYANAREINLTKQLLTIFPEHRILNEVLNYGAASTAFGMDLGSRFNQGVGDLSKPLESVTGVPGIMKDMFVDPIIGAGQSLMEGSTRPFTQDLANALPPLGRGMLQSDHEDFESAVQPDEEAYPGYVNYRKFGDHKDTSINVTRSPREQELGRFGLRSLEEGKKLRIDRLTKAEAQRDQRAIASLNEDLSYSLLTKNPENFERKLSALLKLDPLAVDNSISNVVQKIEESGLTQSQKDALKARTMLAYKRVQDNQRLKNASQSSGN